MVTYVSVLEYVEIACPTHAACGRLCQDGTRVWMLGMDQANPPRFKYTLTDEWFVLFVYILRVLKDNSLP